MSIADIRQALSDVVNAAGLRCSPSVPAQINPPQAVFWRRQADYEQVYGTGFLYNFQIVVYASAADERAAQLVLDEWADPVAGLPAIMEDPATAAAAGLDYIHCNTSNPVTVHNVGGIDYLATEFDLELVGE